MLEVTMEAAPCARMDEQRAGLMRVLEPDARGGVRCRIVQSGPVEAGDAVKWLTGEESRDGGSSPAAAGTRL